MYTNDDRQTDSIDSFRYPDAIEIQIKIYKNCVEQSIKWNRISFSYS